MGNCLGHLKQCSPFWKPSSSIASNIGSNFGSWLAPFEAFLGGRPPRLEAILLLARRLRRQYWMLAVPIASNIGCIFRGSHVPFEAFFEVRLHPLEAIQQPHTEVHLPKIEAILKHCKIKSKVRGSIYFPIACTFTC